MPEATHAQPSDPRSLAADPEREWGPAMAALTTQQRAFVLALVETGCNNTQAAATAGYGESSPTLEQRQKAQRQAGWALTHNEAIQEAIKEEAATRVRAGTLISVSALIDIVNDPKHKDRFKAAIYLASLNGIQAVQAINVNHTHLHSFESMTTRDLLTKIKDFSRDVGLDATELLANAGIVDAEFEEVGDGRSLPAPERSAAGLEDLL
jgi:hypothetical protein